ncbi:hypothetical protein [Rhodopseudomonas palustris]|uniref:Uncharacterized protein n=1 Tax=Rhodopseudomonas palustris (strain BisB18) TaxID=316056 RepID=Q20ZN2_RHOPB
MKPIIEIGYGPTRLVLVCAQDILVRIRDELEPFFTFGVAEPGASTIATLEVHESALHAAPSDDGVVVEVDTSLYKHLASSGCRWGDESRFVVRIDLTGTHLQFDREASIIELWQPDRDRAIIDTVRTIKSLFTPALECAGCVQLHSSGVVDADGGILILGDMWQGKTTLLLDFLASFVVAELSCDTIVAWPGDDGGVAARGWPSPFSMSQGTMSDHPQLYPFYPAEQRKVPYDTRWRERKKTVLTSAQVVGLFETSLTAAVPHVHSVVIVRFQPEQETRIDAVKSEVELVAHLQGVYLGSRDPIYHNWHQYVTCSDCKINANIITIARALLQSADVYVMTWAPSAISLLKRIPRFARLHKSMRDIVEY